MVRNVNWQWNEDEQYGELPAGRAVADLLPWADPYIASLMASLEREYLNRTPDEAL